MTKDMKIVVDYCASDYEIDADNIDVEDVIWA